MKRFFLKAWPWLLGAAVLALLLVTGWLGLLTGKARQLVASLGNGPAASDTLSAIVRPSSVVPVVTASTSLTPSDPPVFAPEILSLASDPVPLNFMSPALNV